MLLTHLRQLVTEPMMPTQTTIGSTSPAALPIKWSLKESPVSAKAALAPGERNLMSQNWPRDVGLQTPIGARSAWEPSKL